MSTVERRKVPSYQALGALFLNKTTIVWPSLSFVYPASRHALFLSFLQQEPQYCPCGDTDLGPHRYYDPAMPSLSCRTMHPLTKQVMSIVYSRNHPPPKGVYICTWCKGPYTTKHVHESCPFFLTHSKRDKMTDCKERLAPFFAHGVNMLFIIPRLRKQLGIKEGDTEDSLVEGVVDWLFSRSTLNKANGPSEPCDGFLQLHSWAIARVFIICDIPFTPFDADAMAREIHWQVPPNWVARLTPASSDLANSYRSRMNASYAMKNLTPIPFQLPTTHNVSASMRPPMSNFFNDETRYMYTAFNQGWSNNDAEASTSGKAVVKRVHVTSHPYKTGSIVLRR
ncbi:hypothetical protein CPB86DRAFT_802544 [Serendipita vermifera]|nr:hypothetical protein CPB86DRAFT_802544 [Serendipita vermifera]